MTESIAPTAGTYPLGTSRPDLALDDLPEPEEVFGVRRIGARELFMYAVGPSLIALGISIGSGEWLLGPQAVGQFGFVGVGWVILVSAVLQTFYNVECSRYVMATGEVPVVGWGRVPPGYLLWVPCRGLRRHLRVHRRRLGRLGRAGRLRAGARRRSPPAGAEEPRLWAIAPAGRSSSSSPRRRKRISRSLELANWVMVGAILIGLIAHRPVRRAVRPVVGGHPRLRHPGRAAGGHHRHPARRPGRLHRARVRPELVRDGPLPRQGLRHGLPHRLHLRPARRAGARCATAASPSPTTRPTPRRWKRWYRLLLDRHVGRLLHRRDARHAAADDPDGPARSSCPARSRPARTCRPSWPPRSTTSTGGACSTSRWSSAC